MVVVGGGDPQHLDLLLLLFDLGIRARKHQEPSCFRNCSLLITVPFSSVASVGFRIRHCNGLYQVRTREIDEAQWLSTCFVEVCSATVSELRVCYNVWMADRKLVAEAC